MSHHQQEEGANLDVRKQTHIRQTGAVPLLSEFVACDRLDIMARVIVRLLGFD